MKESLVDISETRSTNPEKLMGVVKDMHYVLRRARKQAVNFFTNYRCIGKQHLMGLEAANIIEKEKIKLKPQIVLKKNSCHEK